MAKIECSNRLRVVSGKGNNQSLAGRTDGRHRYDSVTMED